MTGYILCTAPRSGSTLLTKMLSATGVAGTVRTPFHDQSVQVWQKRHGLRQTQTPTRQDIEELFGAIRQNSSGSNGVFGLRVQEHSLPFLTAFLKEALPEHETDFERLQALLGPLKVLFLRREDKVAQAVSYVRAAQTGLWHRNPDGTEMERLAPPEDPVFDPEAIAQSMARFERADQIWADWFAASDIAPHTITYEQLDADPQATLRNALGFLGVDANVADKVDAPTKRLRDDLNAEWARRYRAIDQGARQIIG